MFVDTYLEREIHHFVRVADTADLHKYPRILRIFWKWKKVRCFLGNFMFTSSEEALRKSVLQYVTIVNDEFFVLWNVCKCE